MNILHLCVFGPYSDKFSYQENVIPRYHAMEGHNVTVIVRNLAFDYTGNIVETERASYIDEYGVNVRRLPYKRYFSRSLTDVFLYIPILKILKTVRPDLIFIHDAQLTSLSYFDVLKYCKRENRNCIVFGDIHSDYYNSGNNKKRGFLKTFLLKRIRSHFCHKIVPMYKKVYYVAQSCLPYAQDFCRIPLNKMELLPLGFNDELLATKDKENIRTLIREKYGFNSKDIIIVHGGKINSEKRTKELINGILLLNNPNVKLFLFGGIAKEYEKEIIPLISDNSSWIVYFGPLSPNDYYNIYLSSDLAVFPGSQSAIWQEAIGCFLPIVVYYRDGQTQYLNRCGNATFFENQDEKSIASKLDEVLNNNKLKIMKEAALEASQFFSYRTSSSKIIKDYYFFKNKNDSKE